MKLLYSNGQMLSVYDIEGPLYRIHANNIPIKFNGYKILTDDEARATLRELLALGIYERERIEQHATDDPAVGGC